MAYKIKTHRKLENGCYVLEIENGDKLSRFEWPAPPSGTKIVDYEAQQLKEAKALLEDSDLKGRKLKSEGTTL